MRQYETMYIIKSSLDDAAKAALVEELHAIITNHGGKIDNVDDWGLREFAYEIDGMTKGYYVVVTFNGTAAAVAEFERIARIDNNVIRTMMLCLEGIK